MSMDNNDDKFIVKLVLLLLIANGIFTAINCSLTHREADRTRAACTESVSK